MRKTIIFIHGMFQNPKSWASWISYFENIGYRCVAPAWPFHEGEPSVLRANPPANLGDLSLQEIVDSVESLVANETEKPILIGHSVGGLVVQILVNKGLAEAGVAISTVAPNKMLSFDWGFLKNSMLINNPFKGNEPFYTDPETFHEAFCNTMSTEETIAAFNSTATHDSRNVLRDCLGPSGEVDLDRPHAPLLFIGGEKDEIIPADLNEKNAKAYTDSSSLVDVRIFPGRGHFICGQPGWEEIAGYIAGWLQEHSAPAPAGGLAH
jgi:pimeloyl-ACP methyl ester carboxylesterase